MKGTMMRCFLVLLFLQLLYTLTVQAQELDEDVQESTASPTLLPTTKSPTGMPTHHPTRHPSSKPTRRPTRQPTAQPTAQPTDEPTPNPSSSPTRKPTRDPTRYPSRRPTSEPTRLPTRAPTHQPTNEPTKQPTPFPTTCTATCAVGKYNTNWRTDKGLKFCRTEKLQCKNCPAGFYKTDQSIFTGCLPCSSTPGGTHYCANGKRLLRSQGMCTYYSRSHTNYGFDFYEGDPSILEEWRIRDSQGPCGRISVNVEVIKVEAVKPTSSYYTLELENTGSVNVRVNKWDTPNYVKFYDNENNQKRDDMDVVVSAGRSVEIIMVVESSGISVDFTDNNPVNVAARIKFTQVQEFANTGEASASNLEISLPLEIEVIPPSVSILPDEYVVGVAFNSVTEHVFTVYSANYNRVEWTSEVLYSQTNPVTSVNWLSLNPSSGVFVGYECRNDDIVSKGQNSDHATLVAYVDSRNLLSGEYSATIVISNGYKSVLAKTKVTVNPGPMVISQSTWNLKQYPTDVAQAMASVSHVSRLPYTSLQILPRDMNKAITTSGVLQYTFVASWKRLGAANEAFVNGDIGSTEIVYDEFENEFKGSLDISREGKYLIEVKDQNSKVQIKGSPFNVTFLPRECTEVANSIPDPSTGKTCICSLGFGKEFGSNECVPCGIGTYRGLDMISNGIGTCEPCPPGTFQDQSGSSECKVCSGRAQPNLQRTSCEACRGNEVVNENTKFRLCEPCGTGFTVISDKCTCRVDFYDGGNNTCIPCPKGAFCGYGDASTIFPLQGYWQADWDPLQFFVCRKERACQGVTPEQSITLSTTEGWEAFTTLYKRELQNFNDSLPGDYSGIDVPAMEELGVCAKEFTGPLCVECAKGYFKSADGECAACGDYIGSIFALLFLIAIGLFALIYLIRQTIRSKQALRRKEVMVLKIVISHLQIVALVKGFPFKWPPSVLAMFSIFDTLSSAGSSALSVNCLLDFDKTGELRSFIVLSLVYWLIPIVFCLSFALFWFWIYPKVIEYDLCKYRTRTSKKDRSDLTLLECFLVSNIVLLFVLHPLLTSAGLRFFSCTDVSSRSFLEADFTMECHVGEHLEWIWLGASMIALYAIGIPLFGVYILTCIVAPGIKAADKTTLTVYGFLFGGYREGCLYWEIVIMIRKAIFALIAVVLKGVGVDIQAYLGLLVIVISWLLHTHFRPYNKTLSLDWLEAASLAVTFSTIFAGLFLVSDNAPLTAKEIASTYIVVSNILLLLGAVYSIRSIFQSYGRGLWRAVASSCCRCYKNDKHSVEDVKDDLVDSVTKAVDGGAEEDHGATLTRSSTNDKIDELPWPQHNGENEPTPLRTPSIDAKDTVVNL